MFPPFDVQEGQSNAGIIIEHGQSHGTQVITTVYSATVSWFEGKFVEHNLAFKGFRILPHLRWTVWEVVTIILGLKLTSQWSVYIALKRNSTFNWVNIFIKRSTRVPSPSANTQYDMEYGDGLVLRTLISYIWKVSDMPVITKNYTFISFSFLQRRHQTTKRKESSADRWSESCWAVP